MIAGTWMDPMLGVDIHWVLVPAPPAPAPIPTPLPHPFVGIVYDPIGLAVGSVISAGISLATGAPVTGPVLINNLPASNTGTEGTNKMTMPHIPTPPGVGWAPVPDGLKPPIPGKKPNPGIPSPVPSNDAVIVTGSKTVYTMGTNATRLGDLAMSCGEPLRLPSSTVVAVPKGPPVLIGGPPTLDFMAAAFGAIRTSWVSGRLNALASRVFGEGSRAAGWASKAICFLTGHPVDVATGMVFTDAVDFRLPGPFPFRFERTYCSRSDYSGPLGARWGHSYDQFIRPEDARLVFHNGEGRDIYFPGLPPSGGVQNPTERLSLHYHGGAYVITDGSRRKFRFDVYRPADKVFLLSSIEDVHGNTIRMHYDEQSHLSMLVDCCGRVLQFKNDRQGRLVALTAQDPNGEETQVTVAAFDYDERGDLVTSYDALRQTRRYVYVNHLLVQETDRNGLSFYFSYDGDGAEAKCLRTWGEGGIYDHRLFYAPDGTFVENSLGQTTAYTIGPLGLVDAIRDPSGAQTRYEWDPEARLLAIIDPVGNTKHWEYNDRGELVAYTDPCGNRSAAAVGDSGLPDRVVDSYGGEWTYQYTPGRLLSRIVDPLSGEWQFIHDDLGRISTVVDPIQSRLALRYDADHNVVQQTDWAGRRYKFVYDRWGRMTSREDPSGARFGFEYDVLGRLVRIAYPDGSTFRKSCDPEGNVIATTDGRGNTRRFVYRGFRRLHMSVEPGGAVTNYEYDTEQRLVRIGNAEGEYHMSEYGLNGRLARETDFQGRVISYTYDAAGACVAIEYDKGPRVNFQRDPMGRVLTATYSDGERVVFAYDEMGLVSRAENDAAKVRFVRDALGRVVREHCNDFIVDSTYDAVGNRIRRSTSHGSQTSYEYEPDGRLRRIGTLHETIDFERDAAGNVADVRLGRSSVIRQRFDLLGRIQFQEAGAVRNSSDRAYHTGRTSARSFNYDKAGNLTTVTDSLWGDRTHEFDAGNQVTTVTRRSGLSERYLYSPTGSVVEWTYATDGTAPPGWRAPATRIGEYGPGGKLVRAGEKRYEYDARGCLIRERASNGQTRQFKWSASGTLREVEDGGRYWRFAYDPFGRRIAKRQGNNEQTFCWDGNVVAEEGGVDSAPVEWQYFPGTYIPVCRRDKAGVTCCVTDHIGSLTDLVSLDGVTATRQTSIWGEMLSVRPASDQLQIGFQGQWVDDDLALNWSMFRYYEPHASRYVSPDPLGWFGGFHSYRYVPEGNPTANIDPLGLMPWAWNPDTGMGHHLVPRGKANSAGMPLLGTPRHTPTFFPSPYTPGMHETIHAAQRPHIGPIQGPWAGTADELLAAARNGLDSVSHLRGDLRIPATGEVLARNVTPTEAFDHLMEWHNRQRAGAACT